MKNNITNITIQTNMHFAAISDIFTTENRIYTFLNPVSYLDASKQKKLFENFDGIFADGSLLVKAIQVLYGKKIERRSFDMTSLAPELFSFSEKENKTIYIVASKQEEVEKACIIFKEKYPNLNIIGYRNGYFNNETEKETAIQEILQKNPYFLIVGMGAIAQEKFLLKAKEMGFQGIGFTCGGFIHQTAKNEIDYYPQWVNQYNIRFLYRMYKEKHTRKRYIKAGIVFPWVFLKDKFFK